MCLASLQRQQEQEAALAVAAAHGGRRRHAVGFESGRPCHHRRRVVGSSDRVVDSSGVDSSDRVVGSSCLVVGFAYRVAGSTCRVAAGSVFHHRRGHRHRHGSNPLAAARSGDRGRLVRSGLAVSVSDCETAAGDRHAVADTHA